MAIFVFLDLFLRHKAVDGHMRHLAAEIVGDLHNVKAGGAAAADAAGLSQERLATGGGKIGDVVLHGHADAVGVGVGGHGKGEVRQGEDGAALGNPRGVHELRPELQRADGVAGLSGLNFNPHHLCCEAVGGKRGFDFFQRGHGIPSFG